MADECPKNAKRITDSHNFSYTLYYWSGLKKSPIDLEETFSRKKLLFLNRQSTFFKKMQ